MHKVWVAVGKEEKVSPRFPERRERWREPWHTFFPPTMPFLSRELHLSPQRCLPTTTTIVSIYNNGHRGRCGL